MTTTCSTGSRGVALLVVLLGACTKDVVVSDELPPPPWGDPGEVEDVGAADIRFGDGTQTEFFLSQIPVAGTITVMVQEPSGVSFELFEAEGAPPVGDFTHDAARNSVTLLTYVPPPKTAVRIDYIVASGLN